MLDLIACLLIGEAAIVCGHEVARVGVCGPAAYTVDGEHLPLDLAEMYAATPIAVSAAHTVEDRPHARRVPAPRAKRSAAAKAEPELLVETKIVVGARKLFAFEHRPFAGGEAVVVRYGGNASEQDVEARELGAAFVQIMGSGLHVEWSGDRRSLVVAWTRVALTPPAPPKKKANKARANAA